MEMEVREAAAALLESSVVHRYDFFDLNNRNLYSDVLFLIECKLRMLCEGFRPNFILLFLVEDQCILAACCCQDYFFSFLFNCKILVECKLDSIPPEWLLRAVNSSSVSYIVRYPPCKCMK